MKITHEKTKNLILSINGILEKQANNAIKYHSDKLAVEADEIASRNYKDAKIEQLRDTYNTTIDKNKSEIIGMLNQIIEHETIQENILELGNPAFDSALKAIGTTGGKFPVDAINEIKRNFAGQHKALLILKAAFDTHEIEVLRHGWGEYLETAYNAITKLVNQVSVFDKSETAVLPQLREVFYKLLSFGKTRGIEFSANEEKFDVENADQINDLIARQAMGLN